MKTIKATHPGPWWPYFKIVTAKSIRDIHIRTVRLILATASVLIASLYVIYWVLYTGGWIELSLFDRRGYQMISWLAPLWVWATAFYAHAFGVLWIIYARRSSSALQVAVNLLGFVVWAVSTGALCVGLGGITPGSSLEWVMVWFTGWALRHSGGDDL